MNASTITYKQTYPMPERCDVYLHV